MCHVGSYVPAMHCKVGLVDKIFAIIHQNETINDESGFGEDMQDLAHIFKNATNRSLIFIDEFGKSMKNISSLTKR